MAEIYALEIANLKAAIAKLEADLDHPPEWRELRKRDHRRGDDPISPSNGGDLPTQVQDLSGHAAYRALVRLNEALPLLQEAARRPPVGSDINADAAAPGPSDQSTMAAVSSQADDDLCQIRGVTRTLKQRLNDLGIHRFQQIADWTSADRKRIGDALELGRQISQQNWIEQAALLATKSRSATARTPQQSLNTGKASANQDEPADHQAVTHVAKVAATDKAQTQQPANMLVAKAATGLMKKLEANNDAASTSIINETPVLKVAQVKQHQETGAIHNQHAHAFMPRIISEPHRGLSSAARTARLKPHFEPSLPAKPISNARLSLVEEIAAPTIERPPPVPTSDGDANLESPVPAKLVLDRATPQGPPVLPRQKLRFKRIKRNIMLSRKAPQPLEGDGALSEQLPEDVDLSLPRLTEETRSNVRHAPPPLTAQNATGTLKPNRPAARIRPNAPNQGNSYFGDGQRWRTPNPELFGPELDDPLDGAGIGYSRHEEASVEIVRVAPPGESANQSRSTTDRVPPNGHAASSVDVDTSDRDQTSQKPPRHPAKRIFSALKRK